MIEDNNMKVALPIETKVREFSGKLWLALNLVDEGHEVTLGNIVSINNGLDIIKPDIYFGGSAYYRPSREKRYRQIQESGGNVVVLDTEGGVFRSAEAYEKRLSPEILKYVDHFFAWGERPAEIVRQTQNISKEKVHLTGNPRFDLLQPDLKEIYRTTAEKYRGKYGKYVLVNTNFTLANPFDKENIETNDEDKIAYQKDLSNQFISAVQSLANDVTDYTYIIRPHPSEDHDWYRNEFQSYGNVVVKHEGDVRSWIYGATAVIHNSCTTGIESALMQTPVFTYRPIKDKSYDMKLPNLVSNEIPNSDDLRSSVRDTILRSRNQHKLTKQQKDGLKKYIYNTSVQSSKIITDIVSEMTPLDDKHHYGSKVNKKQKVKRVMTMIFGIRRTERILENITNREYEYMRQKFPGLDQRELRDNIQMFDGIVNVPNIKVTHIRRQGDVFQLDYQE